uniref:C2 domain-containing protein n=1 Tax=Soboliphyme baturini TaxID=241478 RepID=A0A183IR04_9BILA
LVEHIPNRDPCRACPRFSFSRRSIEQVVAISPSFGSIRHTCQSHCFSALLRLIICVQWTVSVIGAEKLTPLDKNGLCDPYVIVELVPSFAFPCSSLYKTKTVMKSLNPIFDETFQFTLPDDVPDDAWLHLIVMDYDFILSDDFAGETFLSLSQLINKKAVKQSHTLRTSLSKIARPNDKTAQDFLNRVRSIQRM